MKKQYIAGLLIAGMALLFAACDGFGSLAGDRDELHEQVKEGNIPSYTVSFDGNGQTSGTAPAPRSVKAGSGTNLPGKGGLLKTGHIFAGWNTLGSGSGDDYGVDELYTPEESTVLFAKWLPEGTVIWTVTFESEGITPFTRSVEHGEPVSEPTPQRTGYTFEYWSDYPDLMSAYNFSKPVTKNITLYAKWTVKAYNVQYNPNDGQGSVQSVQHTYDAPQNLLAAIFTRTGYTFSGWNTLASGGGVSYSAEEEVSNLSGWNSGTVPLYAQWKPITYTVSYDANGGVGSAMSSSAFTYDVEGNLRNNSYTLANHEFLGWSIDSGATEATYINREGVTNLATMQDAVVALFAIWKIHQYEVRFDTRGGNSIDHQIVDHGNTATRPSPDPERPNAVFDGWFQEPAVSNAFNFSEPITGNTTIYARWISDEWTVTFDSKGGSAVDAIVVDPNITTTISSAPTAPSRGGYTFGGWFIDDISFSTQFVFGGTVLTGSTTLYAKWTAKTYNVQYYPNGGTGSVLSVEHSYDAAKNLNYNTFDRSNWAFAGWNSQAGGGGAAYLENETVINLPGWDPGPVSLFAQWSCTVTFNKNNSDGGEANPQTKTVTTPATTVGTLPTAPSRTGYTFAGWTATAGGGTAFTASSTVTGSTTVYAQWTSTVTYNKNNTDYGSTEASPQTKTVTTPATTVGILPTAPTRTGYTFAGWSTASSGGTAFTAGTTVTGNVTVYAQWTTNTLSISYANGGGTGNAPTSPVSAAYGTNLTMPANTYTRTGYTFAGWAVSGTGSVSGTHAAGASVAVTALSTAIASGNASIILTATWTTNTLTISYANGGGTGNAPTSPVSAAYGSNVTMPANTYTRTGYTFAGWAVSGTGSVSGTHAAGANVAVTALSTAITSGNASIILTATWTGYTYTVVYDANISGYTGTTSSSSHTYGTAKNLTANGFSRTGFSFAGWATSASGTVVHANEASVSNLSSTNGATVTLYAKWNTIYSIGSTGPGGGIIFFVYESGFNFYTGTTADDNTTEKRYYLEAAPVSTEFSGVQWGANGHDVTGTSQSVYTGWKNTHIIVSYLNGIGESGKAAQLCANLVTSGKDDWFLPSLSELQRIQKNLKEAGLDNFSDGIYYSSSQSSSGAWGVVFSSGAASDTGKISTRSVRAIRAF